jgi:ATP-dependent DNA helicase Rep
MPARQIAAVTFTNKAAREMKARVNKLLSKDKTRGLRISTFHSLGLDIIRRESKTLGFKPGISILDEQDKSSIIKALIGQNSTSFDQALIDRYSRQIGNWKNSFITPEQAATPNALEGDQSSVYAAKLYEQYNRQLKAYNAVDFDDLLLLPVLLFDQNSDALERWQNKIRYLLVDEYQDTNVTQYQLVRLLAGNLGRFTVVGDDQSIYAWRGAQPENLSQLERDYSRLKVIKLEQNYRSAGRILKVANHLIANNPHTFEKKLWSNLGFGDPLKVIHHKNDQAEATQVVSEIIHHKFRHGGKYSDYAILYRGNHQSRLFERGLRENNVPYFISGSTSFFASSEIKDILAYLRIFVNQDDDAAFLRIINTPRREIGPTTLEKLGAYANKRQISLFSACFELGLSQFLPEKSVARLKKFAEWVVDTADKINQGDTFVVIDQFIKQINYEAWLGENSKTQASAERKVKNVNDLIEWLKRIADKDKESEKTLADIISTILLMDILERNQEEDTGDQVSLMTLHASKGLEFSHVFLIGIEENILPHQNSIETDNIEEERRLAYVGITRAQKSCTFSYCTHRKRYGEVTECEPSRFLNELPEEDLEWANKKQLEPDVIKARGKAHLADLKSWLS